MSDLLCVTKRNGKAVPYEEEKIVRALTNAMNSTGEYNETALNVILGELKLHNYITVEEIQDQLENGLMRLCMYKTAKAFILYREDHAKARFIRGRIDYMNEYSSSTDNAATASETDPNANVSMKNVANLEGEVYKGMNREIQRQRMKEQLKKTFPEVAEQYAKDLDHHICYVHDESTSPVCKHYSFSPFECVEAKYNDGHYLLSLSSLYNVVQSKEVLEDAEEQVYCKYPSNLWVNDRNGWTKVSRLTRKRRTNDLYRIKTYYGEDLIVTDNHPMIVSEDISSTVSAENCADEKQYRIDDKITFDGITEIDLAQVIECDKVAANFVCTRKTPTAPYYYAKRHIKVDRNLGYIVGFFIGDGSYDNTWEHLDFGQKDRDVLLRLEELLFESLGVVSYEHSSYGDDSDKWLMHVCSKIVFQLFLKYFDIKDKAVNKCLPKNILMFNEDFALGVIEGIIDSDGTIQSNNAGVCIRLTSRECIMQLTKLLRHFGYATSNLHQASTFEGVSTSKIKSKYDSWGVYFANKSGTVKFDNSIKWNQRVTREAYRDHKYNLGWISITQVDKVDEGSFLDKCEFVYDLTTETNTFDCNDLWAHNCNAVSLYPLITDGIGPLDGTTPSAPNDLLSFSGQVTNLVFILSSQCKGAVGLSEYHLMLNWFIVKDFGENWYDRLDEVVTAGGVTKQRTIRDQIYKAFKQFLYGVNQVAGNRSFQSPFTNFSYFDHTYFDGLFEDFRYPDGTKPEWKAIDTLQRLFMKFFNNLRLTQILTFPVETMCMVYDPETKDIIDQDYKDLTAEMYAEGHSFFTYLSDTVDSVSNCCRLRSELQENTFNPTTGLTGVMTGSCNVITLNVNRLVQDWYRQYTEDNEVHQACGFLNSPDKLDSLKSCMIDILERVYKYHIAYKTLLYDLEDQGMIASSKAGYISMSKLYCTVGLNGLNEAAQFFGYEVSNNDDYISFLQFILATLKEENKKHSNHDKVRPFVFNSEIVPAEGLGGKNYRWDVADGYWVPEGINLYNSYFYNAHDNTSILDKFILHGRKTCKYTDGGSALHCNLEDHLSKEQYLKLIDFAIEQGTNYFTFNIPNSKCDECGYITKHPITECPKCHSKKITQYTRVIGFIRPIKHFGEDRQIEAAKRVYSSAKDLH